jgi:DNA polymerase-3 subunit delta'
MVFDKILGQQAAVQTLQRALSAGRVHHAYRFEGPSGVGKEQAAFALAQALVCTESPDVGCGSCSACRRAVTLSSEDPQVPQHPDVVLLERGLYPPGVLGRTSPETTGLGVEQVRRIAIARAAYPPYEASRLIFIFRAAHELTQSAANALLKTLEEPRPGVHFVLITDQPRRLLDTVRSRTLPIRFGPLPDNVVAEILRHHALADDENVVALASGSAGRALDLCEPEQVARRQRFVDAVLATSRAPDLGAALQLASTEQLERATLTQDLKSLAQHFALCARQEAVNGGQGQVRRNANCYQEVQAAMLALERNAPPALALEALIARLRRQ